MEFGALNQKPNCNMMTKVVVTFPLWYETGISNFAEITGVDNMGVPVIDFIGTTDGLTGGKLLETISWGPRSGSNFDQHWVDTGDSKVSYKIVRECEMVHPTCPKSELELEVINYNYNYMYDGWKITDQYQADDWGLPIGDWLILSRLSQTGYEGYIQMRGKLTMWVDDTCEKCDVPDNPYSPSSMEGYPTGGSINCKCRVGEEIGTTTADSFFDPRTEQWCTRWTRMFEQNCFDVTDPDEDPGHSQDFNDAVNEANAKSDDVTVGGINGFGPEAGENVGDPPGPGGGGGNWMDCGTEFDPQPCDPGGDCYVEQMGTCCSKTTQLQLENAGPCCPNMLVAWTDCPGGGDWVPADPAGHLGVIPPGGSGGTGGNQPFTSDGQTEDTNCPRLVDEGEYNISIDMTMAEVLVVIKNRPRPTEGFLHESKPGGVDAVGSLFEKQKLQKIMNDDGTVSQFIDVCMEGSFPNAAENGSPWGPDYVDDDLISRESMGRFMAFVGQGIEMVLFEEYTWPFGEGKVRKVGEGLLGDTWKEALKDIAAKQKIYCKSHRGQDEMDEDLALAMCRGIKCGKIAHTAAGQQLQSPYEEPTPPGMSPYVQGHPPWHCMCCRRSTYKSIDGTDIGSPKNCP